MLGQLWRIYLLHTPGIAGRTLRSSTRRCSSRDFRLGSLRTVAVVWVVRYVLVLEIHTMNNLRGRSGIIGKTEIPSLFQYNFSTLQGSANVQLLTRQNPPAPELRHTRYDCTSILHGQLGSSKFSLERQQRPRHAWTRHAWTRSSRAKLADSTPIGCVHASDSQNGLILREWSRHHWEASES
jgi:hypothetical protein